MQTFFTSDTHFDDEFAIPYFNRPFKSVDEINDVTPLSLKQVAEMME